MDGSGRITLRNRRFIKLLELGGKRSSVSLLPSAHTTSALPTTIEESVATEDPGGAEDPQLPGVATPPSSPKHPAAASSPPQLEEPLRTVPKVPKMLRDIADHNKPGLGEEPRERPTRLRSGR